MKHTLSPETDDLVDKIVNGYSCEPSSLVSVLQDLNKKLRYLPEEVLRRVACRLNVPLARVYHVATFYNAFSLEPRGKHTINVCMGTACHIRGSPRILSKILRCLGIASGETTPDGEFTLEAVNCVGACALDPVVVVDGHYFQATPAIIEKLLSDAQQGKLAADTPIVIPKEMLQDTIPLSTLKSRNPVVSVCGGTGCQAYGCELVANAFKQALKEFGIQKYVQFLKTGCHGFCETGPFVVVQPEDVFYQKVIPADVPEIVARTVLRGEIIERLCYQNPDDSSIIAKKEIPFYAHQKRIVFGDNGLISPDRIEDYIERGGYKALAQRPWK